MTSQIEAPATSSPSAHTVDPDRWPDVARVPNRPARAVAARRLARSAFGGLPLRVELPDGTAFGAGGPHDPVLRLHRPEAFYQRLGASGLIGFGEAYMAGDWDSDDVVALLTLLAGRIATLVPARLQRLRHVTLHTRPGHQDNTVTGARANIAHHYDLSNELFATFLDESMSYSSALFDGDPASATEPLAAAQHRKIDNLLDVTGVEAGTRLVEIGTGWGALAIRAAARGARVTTATISAEQARLARERIAAAGYADRVDVREQDYRDLRGEYDALVSVEMIEAVGLNHLDTYFATIARLLRPGGRAGVQAISMPHQRMLASARTYTWIVKYIFPGGQIPSVRAIADSAGRAGLRPTSRLHFGASYAETLRRWRERFDAEHVRVADLGFDDTFRAMWRFYLAYSEAGFRSGYLDVSQIVLDRPG